MFYLFEWFHLFSHVPVTGHKSIVIQLNCLYLIEKVAKNKKNKNKTKHKLLNSSNFLNTGF